MATPRTTLQVTPLTAAGLIRWAIYAIRPGDALTAYMKNELFDAVFRSDAANTEALRDIVSFIYWDLPRNCFGDALTVSKWEGLIRHPDEAQDWDPFLHFADERVVSIVRMLGETVRRDLESLTSQTCQRRIRTLCPPPEGIEK